MTAFTGETLTLNASEPIDPKAAYAPYLIEDPDNPNQLMLASNLSYYPKGNELFPYLDFVIDNETGLGSSSVEELKYQGESVPNSYMHLVVTKEPMTQPMVQGLFKFYARAMDVLNKPAAEAETPVYLFQGALLHGFARDFNWLAAIRSAKYVGAENKMVNLKGFGAVLDNPTVFAQGFWSLIGIGLKAGDLLSASKSQLDDRFKLFQIRHRDDNPAEEYEKMMSHYGRLAYQDHLKRSETGQKKD